MQSALAHKLLHSPPNIPFNLLPQLTLRLNHLIPRPLIPKGLIPEPLNNVTEPITGLNLQLPNL